MLHEIRKKSEFIIALFIFAIITILMSWKIALSPTVYGDTPYVTQYSIGVITEYTLHIWHLEALGNNNPWPYVHLLNIPLLYLSNFVGINLYYLARIISIFLSQVSFFIFAQKIIRSTTAKIFSSILYILNPAFITYFNMGGTLYHWVLIPILMKYVYEMVFEYKDQPKTLINVSILLALLFLIFPTFITVVLILVIPPFGYYIFKKKTQAIIKIVFVILMASILIMPYLYYMFDSIMEPTLKIAATSILSDFKYTYQALNPANFLMMIGNVGSPQVKLGYNSYSLVNDIGFLSILLFFIGFYSIINYSWDEYRKKASKTILVTALIFIALSELIRFLTYSNLSFIIEKLFILWTFRNPIKLQLGYATVFPIIAGLGLERLLYIFIMNFNNIMLTFRKSTHINSKNIMVTFFVGLILVFSLAYPIIFNKAAMTGDLGLSTVYGNTLGHLYDYKLSSLAINLTKSKHRGLIIPFDHEVELYVQFHAPLYYISRLGIEPEAVTLLNGILSTKNPKLVENLLKLMSIKTVYVYVDKRNIYFPILNPQIGLDELLNLLDNTSKSKNIDQFIAYEIDNALPLVYLSTNILYYPDKVTLLGNINDCFYEKAYVFVNLKNIATKIVNGTIIKFYNLQIFLDKNYTFYCYSNKCYFKIINSNSSIRFQLRNGQHTSIHLSPGVYRLIYETYAYSFNYTSKFYLNNKNIVLTRGSGNFLLRTKTILIKPGKQTWHTFFITLKSLDNGISYKIIFHTNGIVEIAKITSSGKYIPGTYIWSSGEHPLREEINISISRFDRLLSININNHEHYIVLPDLGKNIEIRIGSDKSITYINVAYVLFFKNNFPSFIISSRTNNDNDNIQYVVKRHSPTEITIDLKNAKKRLILVLNENFNRNWEVIGAKIIGHYRVNMFFNGWIIELSGKKHIIKLIYTKQIYYDILLKFSAVVLLLDVMYLLFYSCDMKIKIIKISKRIAKIFL